MAETSRKSLWSWLGEAQTIIALSAVAVSVAAVAISAYEAHIMREWQRAAVWPYIQLSRSLYYQVDEETRARNWHLTFNAWNVGVGPARIKSFRVTVDGAPQANWRDTLIALTGREQAPEYGQSTINGMILPQGQNLKMMELHDSEWARLAGQAMNEGRLDFEACFCSVFDDCWLATYRSNDEAQPVQSCQLEGPRFQE